MLTDQELITKLQALKQIKPRENWVVFAKANIFTQPAAKMPWYQPILSSFTYRKLAYVLPVFLLLVGGLFGFITMNGFQNSPAALVADNTTVEADVAKLQEKSKNFAQIASDISKKEGVVPVAEELKEAAKNLTNTIAKNPKLAKTVAAQINSNKTYLSVESGIDLKETANALYKETVEPLIEDLKKVEPNFSEEQKKFFQAGVINPFKEGNYAVALEGALLLNNAIASK